MRAFVRAAGLAMVAGLAIGSCRPPETPKHPEYIDLVCQAQCDRQKACVADTVTASCVNRCKFGGSPRRAYEREDYVNGVLACIQKTECKVEDGKEVAVARCRARVAESLQPTPFALERCRRKTARFDECDFENNFGECVAETKLYAEPVLHDLDDCLTHQCTHIGGCFTAVVGKDDGVKRIKKK